ncbi:hypothetical protein [Paraburkholderia youngii]|uniref:hypothetical protein n=1 Tax=Paraburkholderia youngii TaxID=2782701 RepID=UPI003D1AB8B8
MNEIIGEGQIANILRNQLDGEAAPGAALTPEQALVADAERDLQDAAHLSASVTDAGIRLPALASDEAEPTSEDDIRERRKKMMERAAKQRRQGEAGLTRKEAGVATVKMDVEIKARPLSSVFVRWFSAIDMCAGNLARYGEMVLGPRQGQALLAKLTDSIEKLYEEAEKELGRVTTLVNNAEAAAKPGGFVRPTIITPALHKEGVTIGTKLGFKLYKTIMLFDEALELVNPLVWNDNMTEDQQSEQELQYKREFGKLYKFAAQVNINTFNSLKKGRKPKRAKAEAGTEQGAADLVDAGHEADASAGAEGAVEHATHEAAVA